MSMTNNAVRQYRTAAKMSQTDCARILGIPASLLSYIEGGAVVPEMKIIRAMCELFSCSPSSLFDLSQFHQDSESGPREIVLPLGVDGAKEFKALLDVAGYSSLEEWYRDQVRDLRIRAAVMRLYRNIIPDRDGD